MTFWSAEDIRVASVLEAGLGPVHVVDVISHPKENRMTDVMDTSASEDTGWEPEEGASYPEVHRSLADHLYTWSPKLPDGSMMVVRAMSADELVRAVEDLAPVAARLRAAWQGVVGTQGAAPAPQAPQFAPQGGAFGQQAAPQFANQPYAGQPAWQQAGAPQQPAFGGGQQAPANGRQGPKPRPDWPQVWKIDVPFAAKDAFKAFRNDNQDVLKGKVAWAGGGGYWIHGDVVQGFAQYNPVAA